MATACRTNNKADQHYVRQTNRPGPCYENRPMRNRALSLCLFAFGLNCATTRAEETMVPVTFTGGHEYDRKTDHGWPVTLIAAALGVAPEVFREAFSGVTPSRSGPPSREEAQRNKQAL